MNINSDTAKGRGVRTAVQAFIGFVSGLIVTVLAVPGVSEAVFQYITDNLVNFLVLVGVPSAATGIVSWAWNIFRKDVSN